MSPPPAHRRNQRVLYSLIALALLGLLTGYLFLLYAKSPQGRAGQNQGSPILGTWRSDKGNILAIRSDGTARWRDSTKAATVGYFEWTIDANEFKVYQYSGKYSFGWFLKRALFDDAPTSRFRIVSITPTELRLSSENGEVTSFVPTDDSVVEAAP